MCGKKALIVCTVAGFLKFELQDMEILISMGYQVYVATNFSGYENMKAVLDKMGVVRHQIDFCRSPFKKENLRAYCQLAGIMKNVYFHLVHCHTPVGGVLARMAAKKYRKKGTKVIYTAHGFHFYEGAPWKNWLLYYPVEWLCAWWTDVLITINHEDFDRAKGHMHAKRVEYVPGVGVDIRKFASTHVDKKKKCGEFGISQNKFIFLSVGELQERKNQRMMIDALGRMQNQDICYLIAGQGRLEQEYGQLIENYGLQENIRLLGYRTDIAELCAVADCFVHTAFHEGLCVALLEAMASGLPIIASDVRGVRDLVESDKGGICINPKSMDEMQAAVWKMYHNPEFREKCGSYNFAAVKKYDVNDISKIMVILYGKLENKLHE